MNKDSRAVLLSRTPKTAANSKLHAAPEFEPTAKSVGSDPSQCIGEQKRLASGKNELWKLIYLEIISLLTNMCLLLEVISTFIDAHTHTKYFRHNHYSYMCLIITAGTKVKNNLHEAA